MKYLSIVLRSAAALILFQTLYFKFTGAPESVYIFTMLGAEPWGRWFAGGSELIACVLLMLPSTKSLGALMSLGIIAGAILSHIAVLGIVVQNDGGLLFGLAVAVFLLSCGILFLERIQLRAYIDLLKLKAGKFSNAA